MAHLVLIRHGKSEWNKTGQWTGLTDIALAPEGVAEAHRAAESISDIEFHRAHTSLLSRAKQTFEAIKEKSALTIDSVADPALNERNYGIHTGKNKWQVKEEIGEEAFQKLRRGWDTPIEKGETLKDVHARVAPHFDAVILPQLKSGENVLVVAHGNSLRALVKHIENLSEVEVCNLDIGTGEVYCYDFDQDGAIQGKEIRLAKADRKNV